MAGVMGIDESVLEAAQIDGASSWKTFWHVTLPSIKPIIVYVFLTSLIGGIQMFDVPQILTNGSGGPDRTSMTMIMYLNKHLFSKNYGLAGALSVILFIVTAILSFIIYRNLMERIPAGKLEEATSHQGRWKIMTLRRINKFLCYLILILLSILCLFSFYLLIINSTRAHSQIKKDSLLQPGFL